MVLSNKKLKQKLRDDVAESLASTQPNPRRSLKLLLDSATQKPRLSKREKRRENQPSLVSEGNETGSETKMRKRKARDEKDEVLKDSRESDQTKKKKKKNPKKKNKKRKSEEMKESSETENGEKMAVETNEKSQAIGNGVLKVYVGGIPYYSTEDDIRSYFEGCGTVTEVDCMTFPESGKFRGIAIITFKTEAAAKRSLALNGSDMGGLFLTVQPFKANRANKTSDFAPQAVEGYNRIYVGNLSWDITEDKLRNFFSDCKISSIRFGTDKDSGEFRGYAHVDFSDNLSFMMALKLNQKVVCGRPTKISCAVPLKKEPTNKAKTNHGSSMATEIVNPTSLVGSTDIGLSSVDIGKMRKRTCYECGEKGHISSDCLKKSVGPTTVTTPLPPTIVTATMEIVNPTSLLDSNETGNSDTKFGSVVSGKIKRRTCYECGEKGHLSSACPKKTVGPTIEKVVTTTETMTEIVNRTETGNNNARLSSVGAGKLRRRTCYECSEKGHDSSDCPKKTVSPTTFTTPPPPPPTETMTEIANPTSLLVSLIETGNTSAGLSTVSAGKLRRRTCYECGEKGHISSDCPKISEAQQILLQNNLH